MRKQAWQDSATYDPRLSPEENTQRREQAEATKPICYIFWLTAICPAYSRGEDCGGRQEFQRNNLSLPREEGRHDCPWRLARRSRSVAAAWR